jgi:sugar O-acyltransferase (sialic acid O-acetyltransferase NeuD family)
MQTTDIIIVGAGGQGLIVADILLAAQAAGDAVRPIAFVDDAASTAEHILGIPVVGSRDALAGTPHDAVIVAIGDNNVRHLVTDALIRAGERLATARHPTAWLARETQIGEGTMISAGAHMLPRARIGRGGLLNTRASVDHESVLGDFVHVSSGATVGARVTIGDRVLIALGAVVTSGRVIGADTVVGAGAVVVRDLPADVRAWGVPARIRP